MGLSWLRSPDRYTDRRMTPRRFTHRGDDYSVPISADGHIAGTPRIVRRRRHEYRVDQLRDVSWRFIKAAVIVGAVMFGFMLLVGWGG